MAANAAYERFLARPLGPFEDAPVLDVEEMKAAQQDIEDANAEVQRLGVELFGWPGDPFLTP
jgi:hypothetical protein